MLNIERLGFFAHWVDGQRRLCQFRAYSGAGPLDYYSHSLANILVGNSLGSPSMECFGGDISIRFSKTCLIAITGNYSELYVDKQRVEHGHVFLLKEGQCLSLGVSNLYQPCYIAFGSEIDLPVRFNSVEQVMREQGHRYQKIGAGCSYNLGPIAQSLSSTQLADINNIVLPIDYAKLMSKVHKPTKRLKVALSYQAAQIDDVQKSRFLASVYRVTNAIDRMGVRLDEGAAIKCDKTLTSQGTALGAVQITGSGQPIVLRNERQTIGGYPIIGCVSQTSLNLLAYAKPGNEVFFELTTIEESRAHWLCQHRRLQTLSKQIRKVFNIKGEHK